MAGMISASMMCADILNLEKDIRILEENKIDYLHMDVMDGVFVPNYTLGTDFIKTVRSITQLPFDFHLMIKKPGDKLDWFDIRENDLVSFHIETAAHANRIIQRIRDIGAKPAIAINPATPLYTIEELLPYVDMVLVMTVNPGFAGQKIIPSSLEKIKKLKSIITENNLDILIEADGNVSLPNAKIMYDYGVDVFVTGWNIICT